MSADQLALFVLGGFELRAGPRLLPMPVNAGRVVAFLAVRQRRQLRSTVSTMLWPDTSEDRASANLRTALWRLHQAEIPAIVCSGNHLALGSAVAVDLHVVQSAARILIGSDELPTIDPGPLLLAGDLLPDWDEDWVLFERERLRQLRIHALEVLCVRLSATGRHGQAIDAAQAAVAAEPLRESAQRTLIEAHLAEGNVYEAKRQFDLFSSLLGDCMGLVPSPGLVELVSTAVACCSGRHPSRIA